MFAIMRKLRASPSQKSAPHVNAAPMKRFVTRQEVTTAMMFLCGDESSATTGKALNGEFHLAVELPWGNRAHEDWQAVYNNSASDQMECDRSDLAKSIQFQVDLAKSNIPEDAAYIGTGGTLLCMLPMS
jgi:hypothetical protein